jgi:DNA processing protein
VNSQDRVARLQLARSESIGSITYSRLIQRFGTAQAALAALPDLAARGGGKPPRIASRADAERELAAVERTGGRHVFRGLAPYPRLLDEVEGAPAVLIAHGELALFDRPTVALVGARNASAAAVRFARQLALALAEAGVLVISGLARGIDAAAHQGALDHATAAVVAGGTDVFYPPENEALQRAIAEQGALLSEMPPGVEPRARHFPRRNRIIAGLALGTVVVEAAPRSGSLITARLAADYGREVMAVPGSPLDPRAQGCNQLIRNGATLVQSAEDVIESLPPFDSQRIILPAQRPSPPVNAEVADGERAAVVALLGPVAVPIDELVRQSGHSPAVIQTILLELDLAGQIEHHAGGRISLNTDA